MSQELLALRPLNSSTRVTPLVSPNEPAEAHDNNITEYPYLQSADSTSLDYLQATDNLENIILPHQLIIQLLQGPSKSEVKLRLLDMNFDKIITKICFALRKTALQVASKQKLIYKFVLSLVPFLFEKVKSIECSHLMMSPDEIDLLIRSEQDNIIRTFYKSNMSTY